MNNSQIDSTDKKILSLLQSNARAPYLEIARQCHISGAAVHQRMQKLIQAGIVCGSRLDLSPQKLGYMTCAFIGIQINLTSTSTHDEVFKKIRDIDEIVECHHITGKFSILAKIHTYSNEHLKKVIVNHIQTVPEIISTETFISLEEGFHREIPLR